MHKEHGAHLRLVSGAVGRPCRPEGEFDALVANADELRRWFEQEGYLVLRNAVPNHACCEASEAFARDIRPSGWFFPRCGTGAMERHTRSGRGDVTNPVLNFQDIGIRRFDAFRERALRVVTAANIRRTVSLLLGRRPLMARTACFDGSPSPSLGRDRDILGCPGRQCVGVWVATEDAVPEAGRPCVYPGTHRVEDEPRLDGVDPSQADYAHRIESFVEKRLFGGVAPLLRQGDVLIWAGAAVRGQEAAVDTDAPCRGLAAHYIAADAGLDAGPGKTERRNINGVDVLRREDFSVPLAQLSAFLASMSRRRVFARILPQGRGRRWGWAPRV